jgi:coenzyme F420 hydrogenase subunit beta
LFCGWALSWRELKDLLKKTAGNVPITGIDIPPSRHRCMEVCTNNGTIEVPIEGVLPCVRESCNYCFDMTCEFSDISVGSARSPQGWEVDKGWNQVIVRTQIGQELLELARSKKLLEFENVPKVHLKKLEQAAMNKKRACLNRLIVKSGHPDDLLYLSCEDPVVCQLRREHST